MRGDLIPVTSEAELKPGLKVVLKPCNVCGKNHKMMLLNRGPVIEVVNTRNGYHSPAVTWKVAPYPKCWENFQAPGLGAFALAINQNRLFREEDGLETPALTRQKERTE